MEFNVQTNVSAVEAMLNKVVRDQLPFATSLALNNTANEVADAVTGDMKGSLDRPTPFTLKAYKTASGKFKGQRATKRNLIAIIRPDKAQAEYLRYQIGGGQRSDGQWIGVPTRNARLNKFGNVPNRKSGLIKKQSKQFIGEIKNVTGVWERYGRGGKQVKLIHGFERTVSYKKILDPKSVASKVVGRRFQSIFRTALAKAIGSAR